MLERNTVAHDMTIIGRYIVIFLQIFALVAYPQLASAAGPDMRKPPAAVMGVSPDHHADSDAQHSHDHHVETNDTANLTSDVAAATPMKDALTCHPCCVVGTGPCVAVFFSLPDLPEPILVRTFNSTRFDALNSRLFAPQPHPPKAYV